MEMFFLIMRVKDHHGLALKDGLKGKKKKVCVAHNPNNKTHEV